LLFLLIKRLAIGQDWQAVFASYQRLTATDQFNTSLTKDGLLILRLPNFGSRVSEISIPFFVLSFRSGM